MIYHYIDCVDINCPGCLPTDDAVRAMSFTQARQEAARRGLEPVRATERVASILADADEYRVRATAAREALIA